MQNPAALLEHPKSPLLDKIDTPRDLRALDDESLKRLADEVRRELLSIVSETGGHLGSGLGVVELTVALHAVFDTPRDKLIWDVGHQCYPHKILTGRRAQMRTIRKEDGLSGFTLRAESGYDPFGAAHSSTAISAGLGFATARDLGHGEGDVVCVVGDGAMSAGLAYEAINNAGAAGRRIFVVLNDNDMSIAPPVGGLAEYLATLRDRPVRRSLRSVDSADADRLARGDGDAPVPLPTFFEQFGFSYAGPVDGHSIPDLLAMLRTLHAHADGPVLIHALTRKGAGFLPAENAADKYHGVGKFDPITGDKAKSNAAAPSYTKVFGTALADEADRDPAVTAITAAMPSGTGVDIFAKRHPDRAFDVGIAEQHGVTFAAGLAASGMKPFCAIYSTFLQRGFDQVVHDVALQNLPVRFAIDRAGLVGADGATHAGSFDIGYLGNLPNFVVMAAADEAELVHMVATAVAHDSGPIAFRYPRGEGTGAALPVRGEALEIGKGRVVREGTDIALLSFGARLTETLEAAEILVGHGVSATVADARFAKPLDRDLLAQLAESHSALITIEEGATGGFGAQVLHSLAEDGLLDGALRVRAMTLPDRFIPQAAPHRMYEAAGLNASDIAAKALAALHGHFIADTQDTNLPRNDSAYDVSTT